MSRVRAVMGRELRAYFNSPIAYVFLLVFSGAALFTWSTAQPYLDEVDAAGYIREFASEVEERLRR